MSLTLKVLVVAGGGGGGKAEPNPAGDGAGGGGAGGFIYNSNYEVIPGNYTVIIGDGGNGSTNVTNRGTNGSNSSFGEIVATGGGGGGSDNHDNTGANQNANGGSGGGAASKHDGATSGGSASPVGQGNNGGSCDSNVGTRGGAGGGGAGAVGANQSSHNGANGGIGLSSTIYDGTTKYYSGGGGGGVGGNGTVGGTGGNGGGGAGGVQATAGSNATPNTGGGGGGGGTTTTAGNGGNGGSGIVIIRYVTTDFGVCTGGTITTDGAETIHTFTSNGNFSIFENTNQTINAKSNIQKNSIKTLTSKASIKNTRKTINAKSNIQKNSIKTLTSNGSIVIISKNTINAKTCIRNEVYETVRQVAPKIEIQWDGVTWTDESAYFLSAQGNEQLSGTDGQGIASTLDVELDNTGDRFTPNNVDSPLYGYIKPRVPIRLETIIGTSFRLFTGYIKNFHPDIKSKLCSLECYDNQVLLNNKEANGIVYEDNRTDELLTVLATLAELDPAQYTFEVGLHIVNFGYFENRNVWPVMGELAIAERGRIFFDRYGTLTFWNRDHLHNQTSIITLTQNDWILDLDYSIAEHDIKNYITVQAKPRASAGIQVVWSNGDVQYLDAYSDTLILIPANGSQSAWLELEDPCSTFIPPVSGTDFIANSEQDSSGVDLTSNIFVNQFIEYGDSVYVNVVNTGDTDAYLVKFQVRGNPAQVLNYIQVNVQDTTSISLYGKQDETIQNNFIQDEGSATEIAYEELWRRQDAVNNFDINIVGIPYLLCGDLVSVEYIKGSYDNYLIEQISWTLDSGGFKEKLRLTTPYIFPTIQRIDAKAMIVGGHFIKTVTSKGNIT
jgi:hypothetical protein